MILKDWVKTVFFTLLERGFSFLSVKKHSDHCPCQDMLRDESWEDFKKTRKYRELRKMFDAKTIRSNKP
jgi:hypothetical protein